MREAFSGRPGVVESRRRADVHSRAISRLTGVVAKGAGSLPGWALDGARNLTALSDSWPKYRDLRLWPLTVVTTRRQTSS